LSLKQPSRCAVDDAGGLEQGEPVFRGGADLLLALSQRFVRHPQMLVKPARMVLRVSEAERMLDRSRDVEHLTIHRERPLGIAKLPQRKRQITAMSDARIFPDAGRPGPRTLAIVILGERSLILLARGGKLPAVVKRHSEEK